VDGALAASAHVIEATFDTQPIDIAFLEPESCLVVPQPDGVTVHTESQGSVYDHAQIARILNLDPARVEIALAASGGAFGAKEDLNVQCHAALLAKVTGRPASLVLSRAESLRFHPKRHPMVMDYTIGADAEGRLTALRARIVGDTGAYASVGEITAALTAVYGRYREPVRF